MNAFGWGRLIPAPPFIGIANSSLFVEHEASNVRCVRHVPATGREITVHNVRLINVEPPDNGQERLIVEYKGTQHELLGAGPWDERHSRQHVRSVGHLVPKRDRYQPLKTRSYYFRAYRDPSLRRVPELDMVTAGAGPNSGGLVVHHGWCCDVIPGGFRAPARLIPGDRGKFVPDGTEILRDDIETLLLQHEYTGGNPQELLAAVQRIVEGNSVDTDADEI